MIDETTATAATDAVPQGATEVSSTQTSGDASAPPAETKGPAKGVQKRIDELTANWRTTERDRDHWRELALQKAQAPVAPSAPQGKPTLEQFEFDQERYIDALADWKLSEATKAAEAKRKEDEGKSAAAKRRAAFDERAAKYAADKADYQALISDPTLPVSQAMAEAILDADEDGPALLYHLAQNRDEAARIFNLPERQAALALGRIVAKLSAAPSVEAPQIPTAPKPVPVVKPSAPVERGLSDELPVKEWLARRNKEAAKKRG